MNSIKDTPYTVNLGYDALMSGDDPRLNEREAERWRRDMSWVHPYLRRARRREAIIDTLYALGYALVWVLLTLDF